MERLTSGPLAAGLERNRERFNARFLAARRQRPSLDPREFLDHLRVSVAPVLTAVAAVAPDRTEAALTGLYDASLELFVHDGLGGESKYPIVANAWRELLPDLARFLAAEPGRTLSAVMNALFNLSGEGGAAERWMAGMKALAPACSDVGQLLDAGRVLAWRSGLAHYRDSALAVWKGLPEGLKRQTIGAPTTGSGAVLRDLEERLMKDPWFSLDPAGWQGPSKPAIRAKVGGFRGFGGPFIDPPQVVVGEGAVLAFDSESCWSVHADAFGATVRRCPKPDGEWADNHTDVWVDAKGAVDFRGATAKIPQLKDGTSFASTATLLAVTLSRSHYVYVVGCSVA